MQRIRKGVYQLEAAGWVNAYLLEGPRGLTLVDTGHSKAADALGDEIERSGFSLQDLEQVLITHAHFDHVGGAAILLDRKRVKVYAHPHDIPQMKGVLPKETWHRKFGRWLLGMWFPWKPLEVLVPLQQGQTLRALPTWQVLHTPGHTAGSLSLYQPTEKILIAGDALANRNDKLSLSPSLYNDDDGAAFASAQRLAALDCDVLCCGHGPVIRTGGALKLQKLVESLL